MKCKEVNGKIIYTCEQCPYWEAEWEGAGTCGETIGKCNHPDMLGAEVIYETRGYRFSYSEEIYDDCPLEDAVDPNPDDEYVDEDENNWENEFDWENMDDEQEEYIRTMIKYGYYADVEKYKKEEYKK